MENSYILNLFFFFALLISGLSFIAYFINYFCQNFTKDSQRIDTQSKNNSNRKKYDQTPSDSTNYGKEESSITSVQNGDKEHGTTSILDKKNEERKMMKKQEKKAVKELARFKRERHVKQMREKSMIYEARQDEKEKERSKKEELENIAIEKRNKKLQDEYKSWKRSFKKLEEGKQEFTEENDLVSNFVHMIISKKLTRVEDIAAHFDISIQDTIDRINELEKEGILYGVFDDEGKYLYLTNKEVDDLVKKLKERGRISISEELVSLCNSVLSTQPNLDDSLL